MKKIVLPALIVMTAIAAGADLWFKFLSGSNPYRHASLFLAGMLIILMLLCVFIANVIAAFAFFRKHRFFALLPLAMIVGSCALDGSVYRAGYRKRLAGFEANLARFNQIISKIDAGEMPNPTTKNIISSNATYIAFETPNEYKDIVPYCITVNRENNGSLTVRCVLCAYFPNMHHRTYIYRPDGDFMPYMTECERVEGVINENWAAIYN